MLKLFNLLKINLISYFNFYKILNAKTFAEKIKELIKFLFIILIYIIFGVYIYLFAKLSMDGFIKLNSEYVLLGEFFALSSIFALFSSIFKVDSLLFNTKDYEMLISLPIKRTTIIGSKMLNLFVSNLIFVLVIMVPVLLVYTLYSTVSATFYIMYILSMLIIPLIPTIVAVIIGSLITTLSSRFKFKKVIQFLFMILILVGSYYISFKTGSMAEIDIANIGQSLVNIFNNIYPLTNTYMKMLFQNDLLSTILYFSIPIIIYYLSTLLISLIYTNVVTKIHEKNSKHSYRVKEYKVTNPTKAILKKEFKRYISSPTYVMNSSFGVILLLIASIALLFISPNKLESIVGIPGLSDMLLTKGPFIIGLMLLVSCTTSSSFSLEGKNMWILKSLPFSHKQIFNGKILFNVLLLVIPGFISSIVFVHIFNLGVNGLISFIVTIILYSLFTSIFGLIINIHFPLLNWKNEVRVIKQSMSTFISLFGGMIIGIIPLIVESNLSSSIYLLLVDAVIAVLIIVLYVYLNTIGKKIFNKINC